MQIQRIGREQKGLPGWRIVPDTAPKNAYGCCSFGNVTVLTLHARPSACPAARRSPGVHSCAPVAASPTNLPRAPRGLTTFAAVSGLPPSSASCAARTATLAR